jgi:catalase
MVGNNTPLFFVRDPMKFQQFMVPDLALVDAGTV